MMERDERKMTDAQNEKVIVALDVDSPEDALALARNLQGTGCWLKVGLELYVSGGKLVDEFKELGFWIFLDLKLDIPTTVERTLRVLMKAGVDPVDLH